MSKELKINMETNCPPTKNINKEIGITKMNQVFKNNKF